MKCHEVPHFANSKTLVPLIFYEDTGTNILRTDNPVTDRHDAVFV